MLLFFLVVFLEMNDGVYFYYVINFLFNDGVCKSYVFFLFNEFKEKGCCFFLCFFFRLMIKMRKDVMLF